MTIHRFLAVLCVLAVSQVSGSYSALAQTESDPGVVKLTILHMNDPHAHYLPEKDANGSLKGGFAKAASVIRKERGGAEAQGREVLVLMAGDLLTGTPFSTAFKGRLGVPLMNLMGFDMSAVGNHEFDYGFDNFLLLKSMSKFPWLAANIDVTCNKPKFHRLMTKPLPAGSGRIVIFGLTTADTPSSTFPGNVVGMSFRDPITSTKALLEEFSEEDVIIAVTHLGIDEDKKLALACPKIDVIIGGHSHTVIDPPLKQNRTLIAQAGSNARRVGKLELDAKEGRITNERGTLIDLGPDVAEDQAIATTIKEYEEKLPKELFNVIGSTDVLLANPREQVPPNSFDLGVLMAYLQAQKGGAAAGIANAGGVRTQLPPGPVRWWDVLSAFPFENTLVTCELSGADLVSLIQQGTDTAADSGGSLRTSGIVWKKGDGAKVQIEKVGGRDFRPDDSYVVATNNYLAAGGDKYEVFKERGKNLTYTSTLLSDLLVEFFKAHRPVTAETLKEIK